MKNKLNKLKKDISSSLEDASLNYYYHGMGLYDEIDEHNLNKFQIALGNITIACELLLKAFIARKMFGCLYPKLRKNYQAILFYPEAVPYSPVFNTLVNELKSFSVDTVGINEAISFFYQLYPDKQEEYKPHLKFISEIRNTAVHASMLDYQMYILHKVVYISTKLFLLADEEGIIKETDIGTSSYYEGIIDSYDTKKINKVETAKKEAKRKLQSIKVNKKLEPFKYEKNISIQEICPICDSKAISYGYIEGQEEYLNVDIFCKTHFFCKVCEFTLDDEIELRLASICTLITV